MRDAQANTDQALAAGLMNGASRSLAARVEEHKVSRTKLRGEGAPCHGARWPFAF